MGFVLLNNEENAANFRRQTVNLVINIMGVPLNDEKPIKEPEGVVFPLLGSVRRSGGSRS